MISCLRYVRIDQFSGWQSDLPHLEFLSLLVQSSRSPADGVDHLGYGSKDSGTGPYRWSWVRGIQISRMTGDRTRWFPAGNSERWFLQMETSFQSEIPRALLGRQLPGLQIMNRYAPPKLTFIINPYKNTGRLRPNSPLDHRQIVGVKGFVSFWSYQLIN